METSVIEQLRMLTRAVEQSPASIVITDAKGNIEYVNPKFTALTGYTAAEALGQNPRILKTGDLPPEAYRNLWETILAGRVWQGEFHNRKKNGETYWESATISPVLDAGGKITHFLAVKEDTTERKLADLEIVRTNRALKMLSGANDALLHAASESALLARICEVAVIFGCYRMCCVGYAVEDEAHTIKIMAQAGRGHEYFSKIKFNWDERSPLGCGPAGRAIRGGQPVICADMEADPSFLPWREAARQHGLRSCVCLPLRAGERTFGLLGLYSAEVSEAGPEEIKLLREMADDLAFGIDHLRAKLAREMADAKIREQAALLDHAHEAILVRDLDDHITYWNQGAERTYGWTAAEAAGRKSCDLLQLDPASFQAAGAVLLDQGAWEGELRHQTKDGRKLTVDVRWTLVRDQAGRPQSILAMNSDITQKKNLEQQFLRAQRMESLGTLAGGLAHDLNNALGPIIMAIDILKLEIQDPALLETLATMRSSAQRGADMVKQVLAFARGTDGQHLPIKLSFLVEELRRIIADTFPRNLQVEVVSPRDLWHIQADPTQLHQVIMNLCLNARDAMPNGGKLTLKLENQVLDEVFVQMNPQARPGPYVTLRVSDTGEGIPPEIQNRIFDPFFTTKEFGKGTGLGLSTALGLVNGHGGFINLYSEVGRGTTFKLFFPALTEAVERRAAETEAGGQPGGQGELILVVDDEEQLRNIVKRTLERFGYRVVLAQNGAEAIAIYGQNRNTIAAVLTDMAMPIMDGPATIVALKSMNPQVTIIGSSGLPANGHLAQALGTGVQHFVPKPYDAGTLLRVLAQALAEAKSGT